MNINKYACLKLLAFLFLFLKGNGLLCYPFINNILSSPVNVTSVSPASLNLLQEEQKNFIQISSTTPLFGIEGLNFHSLNGSININDNFRINPEFSYFGNQLFSNSNLGINISALLWDGFIIGGGFSYNYMTVSKFSDKSDFYFTAGSAINISDNLKVGILFKNFDITGLNNELYPSTIDVGFGILTNSSLDFDVGFSVIQEKNTSLIAAVSYNYNDFFKFRLAYGTFPQSIDAAFFILPISDIYINFNFLYHNNLGMNNQLSLGYFF